MYLRISIFSVYFTLAFKFVSVALCMHFTFGNITNKLSISKNNENQWKKNKRPYLLTIKNNLFILILLRHFLDRQQPYLKFFPFTRSQHVPNYNIISEPYFKASYAYIWSYCCKQITSLQNYIFADFLILFCAELISVRPGVTVMQFVLSFSFSRIFHYSQISKKEVILIFQG